MGSLAILAAIAATAALADDPPAYRAYWLAPAGERAATYQRLLVTIGPIEDLSGRRLDMHRSPARPLVFDHPALGFATVGRDSLWEDPFRCIPALGIVDPAARTAEMEGVVYAYEPCPLAEVLRLLEKPLGSGTAHRRIHPLAGAERTAQLFADLLRAQLARERE